MAVLRCRVGNQQGRAQWTKDGFALGKSFFLLQHLIYFISSIRRRRQFRLSRWPSSLRRTFLLPSFLADDVRARLRDSSKRWHRISWLIHLGDVASRKKKLWGVVDRSLSSATCRKKNHSILSLNLGLQQEMSRVAQSLSVSLCLSLFFWGGCSVYLSAFFLFHVWRLM